MSFDLDGRSFRPVENSEGGRVSSDTIFRFQQSGPFFRADYAGPSVMDGHLIGTIIGEGRAVLLYHSRSVDGMLEAGEADAHFGRDESGLITIAMDWQWLNGSRKSGESYYREIEDGE